MGQANNMAKLQEMLNSVDQNAPARARLSTLFDENSFVEIDAFALSGDDVAEVVAGYGSIEGSTVYAFSQNINVNGGAVSAIHAKKIIKIYDLAAKTGCPVVAIFDSNGARIAEGNAMLAAYSEMLMKSNKLSGVIPQIAVVLGTCGGTNAMLASSADFVVMSKNAQMFMTAPFITAANGDKTQGAGSADNAAKAGVASIVCEDDTQALEETRKLISLLPLNNLAATPFFEYAENPNGINADNTDANALINAVADVDSVIEICKEYGAGMITALATLGGQTVGFVASNKLQPLDKSACEKAVKFIKVCDSFNVPLVTFVDTNGFEMTADVSIVKDSAKLANAYAEATTVKVSVIVGTAFGAAYIALGSKNSNSDITIAWPNAQISALAPETAVEFLWADRFVGTKDAAATRKELVEEYVSTVASPFELAKEGFIEAVIDPANTRYTLISTIDMLSGKRETNLPKKHTNI